MGSEDEEYERLLDEIDGIANSPQHRSGAAPAPIIVTPAVTTPFSPPEDVGTGVNFSPPPSSQALQQPIAEPEHEEEEPAIPVHKILPRWDGQKHSEGDIGDEIEGLLGDLGPQGHGPGGSSTPLTSAPGMSGGGGGGGGGLGGDVSPTADGSWNGMFSSVAIGAAEERGQRPSMEDKHARLPLFMPHGLHHRVSGSRALAAVFDGHSGAAVANYAVDRIPSLLELEPWYTRVEPPAKEAVEASLISVFERTDGEILAKTVSGSLTGGSTACVALLLENRLFVANLGDSRAVLSRGGTAEPLSVDHKPCVPAERERIEGLDGKVEWRGCWRVMGSTGSAAYRGLAVSRALGDVDWKVPVSLVESKPEVKVTNLRPDDEFVIIGCDGVWDVLSNQEAVDLARRHAMPVEGLEGSEQSSEATKELNERIATKAAKEICLSALERGSLDNVTVVVMTLQR